MGLLGLLRRRKRSRVVVMGLDGVPFSFLQRQFDEGRMQHLAGMAAQGAFAQADSVHPCVSCVAWSCYLTGRNPGKHDIYGFQDRRPGTLETYIPTGRNLQGPTVWELLSQAGKRVVSINVPGTYPPRPVNGLMVGDFLSPKLQGATHPPEFADRLESLGYRIDIEPGRGRHDKEAFLIDLNETFEARRRTMLDLMSDDDWDVLQVHFMGTDRINHFLFGQWEARDPQYAPAFDAFYERVDAMVGEVASHLGDETTLICLSDHGFCGIRKEVYLNTWLTQEGYLEPLSGERPKLNQITGASRAYCLDPGRVYINLRDREPGGRVAPGSEYEALRDEIAGKLTQLQCPDTGESVIRRVYKREELFTGPFVDHGPDLVADPYDGYDLKGQFGRLEVFVDSELSGMHTYDDAFWMVRGHQMDGRPGIMDGAPTLLKLVGETPPEDMDGRVVVA